MQKALTNSSMLPACNGAMMRNIYQASAAQANSRNYQYSGAGSINSMSAATARYPPMTAAAAYPPMGGQPFGMGHTAPMTGMARQDTESEADWYNKGFSALRMNSGPHNHANLAAPMLQYQT